MRTADYRDQIVNLLNSKHYLSDDFPLLARRFKEDNYSCFEDKDQYMAICEIWAKTELVKPEMPEQLKESNYYSPITEENIAEEYVKSFTTEDGDLAVFVQNPHYLEDLFSLVAKTGFKPYVLSIAPVSYEDSYNDYNLQSLGLEVHFDSAIAKYPEFTAFLLLDFDLVKKLHRERYRIQNSDYTLANLRQEYREAEANYLLNTDKKNYYSTLYALFTRYTELTDMFKRST